VMAKISCGCTRKCPSLASTPSKSARTMRDTSIQVLPAPAQASILEFLGRIWVVIGNEANHFR
jgi:hypothetical protein